jgi:GTP-binding protein Era
MNLAAMDAIRRADCALVFIDVTSLSRRPRRHPSHHPLPQRSLWSEEDSRIVDSIPKTTPWVLILNKVDQLRDKSLLLPLLSELAEKYPDHEVIPISSLDAGDVNRVLNAIELTLPEGNARYPSDTITDRPVRYFAAEYIREQVMRTTRGELPFAIAVAIDEFSELAGRVVIQATISVEKDGQRVILIGHKGHQIREIGTLARKRIERLLEKKVHLQLFVRTTKRWKDNQTILTELGYGTSNATQPASLKPGER